MTERRTAEELQEGLQGFEECWPWPASKPDNARLEDYVFRSKKGERLDAAVVLSKRAIRMSINPSGEIGGGVETEAYLLLGTYHFTLGDGVHEVSKVYAFGSDSEGSEAERRMRAVANERLEADYERLREAGIPIEKMHFG